MSLPAKLSLREGKYLKVNSPGEQILVSGRWTQFRHDKQVFPLPGVLLGERGSKLSLPFPRSLALMSLKEGNCLTSSLPKH